MRVLDNLHRFKSHSLEECIQLSIVVVLVPYTLLDLDFSAQNSRKLKELAALLVFCGNSPLFYLSYGCDSLVFLAALSLWRSNARGEQQA